MLGATLTVDLQWPGSRFGTELGYLEGWIDFNADGDWDDQGEQIVVSEQLTIGQHTLSFDVPNWAVAGTTYARFRISSVGGLGVTGTAVDGEVEDYEVTITDPAADFGDAPAPYFVTKANNGARHVPGGPSLGSAADIDSDGIHSPAADGDSDDGVTFSALQVGQLSGDVVVNVQGVSGKLDAWVDFDGDGSWGGPGEQIFDSIDVAVGDNALTFRLPPGVVAGTTYARFRLSSLGGLGLTGLAADGEVEDHAVVIAGPTAGSGQFSASNSILSGNNSFSRNVQTADVDGDGDLDVLNVWNSNAYWHENDGSGAFTTYQIGNATEDAFATDLDGDGDLDVLADANGRVGWYENDGNQNFALQYLSGPLNIRYAVVAADLDADGDQDVLATSSNNKIYWLENDGQQNFTVRELATGLSDPRSLTVADVDDDGHLDVLAASYLDDTVAWYRNDGSGTFAQHVIADNVDGATSLDAIDLDLDGDIDVLATAYLDNKIIWYQNNGSGSFTSSDISINLAVNPLSVHAVDIDGDGDMDVLSASSADYEINLFVNDGSQSFTNQLISRRSEPVRDVTTGDVDGDGDLDILATASFENSLAWHEQVGLDFGDAPLGYPTTLAEDGARHPAAGPRLGALVDQESDGTHSAAADGDIDDDGVSFGIVRVGAALGATVTVDLQRAELSYLGGRLDGWIDFNADGDWDDDGEQIFASQQLGVGLHTLTFDVPNWASDGTTYARFRVSTDGSLLPTGPATDGEVQDHQVTIIDPPADYGDAPEPYFVTNADNGARHEATGPTLGALRDIDSDGVPSVAGNADDVTDLVDEDGVTFGAIQVGQASGSVTVNVQGGAANSTPGLTSTATVAGVARANRSSRVKMLSLATTSSHFRSPMKQSPESRTPDSASAPRGDSD